MRYVFTVEVDDTKFAQEIAESLGWDVEMTVIAGPGPIQIVADQSLIDHPRPTTARAQAIFWEAFADACDAIADEF